MSDEELQAALDSMDYEYLDILKETNMETAYELMITELVFDSMDMSLQNALPTVDKEFRTLKINFIISKYALFIWFMQSKEEYEKCADLRGRLITVLNKVYSIKRDALEANINFSIQSYTTTINNDNH